MASLPLYWVANLHASYQLDEHVQFFGLINNIFNNRNATYGTFLDTSTDAQDATPVVFNTNPRTVTPLQPISFYGHGRHGLLIKTATEAAVRKGSG